MKVVSAIAFTLLISSVFLFSGCEQKDSAVGSDLAPGLNDIFPEELILYPSESAFYYELATTGDSDYLYVGRGQEYEAYSLIRFNPHTAVPDSYRIDSINISLYLDSVIVADPVDPMQIDVIPVDYQQTWSEIGVVWDDINLSQLPEPIASFEFPAGTSVENQYNFIPYEADSSRQDSLVRAWEEASSGTKTLFSNNGLVLKSDKTAEHMIRFKSSEHDSVVQRPALELFITVIDTTGETDSTYADTVLLYATTDAFLVQDSAVLDSSYLYLGNAVGYRSILLFDVEGLFPTFGVGIHRAQVILHADTTNEFNFDVIEGVFTFEMSDSSWLEDPATAPYQFGSFQSPTYFEEETATLTVTLTDEVYNWIRYPGTNRGFMIRTSAPLADISRTVFYGIDAPEELRPRMNIIYLENSP
jgi:hypothetical protein